MKRPLLAILLLCVATATACACACPEPDPEAEAKRKAALDDAWTGFQTIAKDVPAPASMEVVECDDSKLRKLRAKMKKPKLWAKSIDYDFLAQMGDKQAKPDKGWEFLNWDTAEQLVLLKAGKPAGKREGDIRYWLGHDESRFLVVFRANSPGKKVLPKLKEDPSFFLSKRAVAVSGEHFDPGVWDGWMVVYDRETNERLCQAPLSVTSRHEVEFKTSGAFAKDADDAVRDQFKEHFNSRVQEALTSMTGELDLSLH